MGSGKPSRLRTDREGKWIPPLHRMSYHHYADDAQLYSSVLGEMSDAVEVLSWCLEAVEGWMGNNRLQLNPDK